MKRRCFFIVSICCLIIFFACHTPGSLTTNNTHLETIDSRGNVMLLGTSTRSRLQRTPFDVWFNKNYSEYKLDTTVADSIKNKLKDKRFVIFMGTWCGDSRSEVPKIYKLLDYCGIPNSRIRLVNLSYHDSVYKQSPTHEERGLGIHRVPDLLVFQDENEIGRIIEKPIISWEADLLAIVNAKNYKPRYQLVTNLQQILASSNEEEFEERLPQIADSLRSVITKNEGLQSFGNVLFATNEKRKALSVLRLNTMLYPTVAAGFAALADSYMKMGHKGKAKENYERVLEIDPSNAQAKAMVEQLSK